MANLERFFGWFRFERSLDEEDEEDDDEEDDDDDEEDEEDDDLEDELLELFERLRSLRWRLSRFEGVFSSSFVGIVPRRCRRSFENL